ncbi:MAG: N-acetyl-gamma-glutamyl-phosphate reductase [Omnitrophica WOR_2 bacterium RIFCSPLOWO2_12_FULL_46_30]|nr:MAG: N-acetyl-gamma-glutamyl-phosphate reductase [Omnitrophica WOR_2 bacterium RIFCSPLOWO2_12_FULL_46_30]
MLRVGIIGVRGYTGEQLLDLLLRHSRVKINYLTARVDKPVKISELFPQFKNRLDLVCDNFNLSRALESADLFFLALPHTASMDIAPLLRKGGKKVIDLSADYRLKDYKLYEAWYKAKHKDRKNLKKAVYGLPEIHKVDIREADFIANPGCYSTLAILSLAPLVQVRLAKLGSIIIDAKSGYSGAGRKSTDDPFWGEIKDNFNAYKVDNHQHTPEIEQELSKLAKKKIKVTFVPHLLPIERGILETIYVRVTGYACLPARQGLRVTEQKLIEQYKRFYKDEPFVRIKGEGEFPSLRDVQYTNFCDIGIKVSQDKKLLIIISAIDNLVKGASGQAVQNMNLMCGFRESEGLPRRNCGATSEEKEVSNGAYYE